MSTTTFQIYFKMYEAFSQKTTMWSNSISQIDIFSHNNHTCNKKCNEKGVSSVRGEFWHSVPKLSKQVPPCGSYFTGYF